MGAFALGARLTETWVVGWSNANLRLAYLLQVGARFWTACQTTWPQSSLAKTDTFRVLPLAHSFEVSAMAFLRRAKVAGLEGMSGPPVGWLIQVPRFAAPEVGGRDVAWMRAGLTGNGV